MRFVVIFLFLILSGCSSQQPKQFSLEDEAAQQMSSYRLERNDFYGFELRKPLLGLPAGTSIQTDDQTGGKKYIFKDPGQVFSIITLYENNGVLSRITLARTDDSARQSALFYDNLLKQAKQDYPANVFVDSGIGAYMHFLNDPQVWVQEYVAFENAKRNAQRRYSNTDRAFSKGLHESLASIAFNQFAGQGSKTHVMVDYVTADYQQAGKRQSDSVKSKIKGI